MKKLLFLLGTFMPLISLAQFEAGVNAGKNEYNVGYSNFARYSTVYNATLSYTFLQHIKVGIGYEQTDMLEGTKSPFLSADFTQKIGRSEIYAGGIFGRCYYQNINPGPWGDFRSKGIANTYGMHIGYSYNVYKGICINAQVSYDYVHFPSNGIYVFGQGSGGGGIYGVRTYPYLSATLGVHYKLSYLHKPKKPVADAPLAK